MLSSLIKDFFKVLILKLDLILGIPESLLIALLLQQGFSHRSSQFFLLKLLPFSQNKYSRKG